MNVTQRYTIKKEAKTDVITYKEYETLKGYQTKPKKTNYDDIANVSKMIVINPSLIEKLIDKKCKKTFERILKMISIIYEDEDGTDPTPLELALNELEKFKTLLREKYKEYMKEKEYKLMKKKIEILEMEIKSRKEIIYNNIESKELKTGKKGR